MRKIVTFNSLGRYGRFANQMFQIAGTIGIARKNGFDFAFPEWKNYDHAERFGSEEDIDLQKYFENPLPIYRGPTLSDRFVDWGYHDIQLKDSCSLSGHMQSEKYFAHCMDEVRWYFRMKDEYERRDKVAIHVRLGDYDNAYHPRMDMRYYATAIDLFPKGTKFLVFSDDLEAASDMFVAHYGSDKKGERFQYVRGDYIDSFKLMKACRHFIIGNSSYSAMAAILGEAEDKKIIAPEPWFGPAYTNITGADIFGEGWTVINYEQIKTENHV
jgi:hypothetical protein